MLDPNDLPEVITRRRPSGILQSPRGKVRAAGYAYQSIQCLIQPHRGGLKYEVEGTLQDVTETLYCNLLQGPGQIPTDIQFLDTMIRASGQHFRVGYVADEGGQGDHLKVYLIAVNTGAVSPALPENLPMLSSNEQQVLQAQIDLLTQKVDTFLMAYEPGSASATLPKIPITTTVTLTMPTGDTRYPVNITANTVVTLPAADGSGKKLYFDFDSLSTFALTFALNGTDSYVTPLPPIVTGATFALVTDATGKWSIE